MSVLSSEIPDLINRKMKSDDPLSFSLSVSDYMDGFSSANGLKAKMTLFSLFSFHFKIMIHGCLQHGSRNRMIRGLNHAVRYGLGAKRSEPIAESPASLNRA